MYVYNPPKSSVWGHSLRKMRPAEISSRFADFLNTAVGEHRLTGGNAFYQPTMSRAPQQHPGSDCLADLARVLGVPMSPHALSNLGSQQVELCLEELTRNDSLYVPGVGGAVVLAATEITKWRIRDQLVPTSSLITLYYGANPRISTFLAFNELEEFEFIRQALKDAGICSLNDKHLKQKKARKKA